MRSRSSRRTTYQAGRRRFLAGLGAVAAAPVVLSAGAAPVPAAAAGATASSEPECLADLVASGEVTRADFVAR